MFFHEVNEAQADPIFGLMAAVAADPRPNKVNLTGGIYKDENLKSELLSSVRMAKEQIAEQERSADYLPIDGLSDLTERLGALVFGGEEWKKSHGRIYGAHTTGGTGALRVGFEFLAQEVGKKVYVSNYTWPNHRSIVERAGCSVENYPYYSHERKRFDFEAMIASLEKLPPKSIVLLHACCHNPTGCDPTAQEWKEISLVMREKKLLPFFDFAYQGFGEGLEEDAQGVRTFLRDGHEMLIAYSCAKNFSMYGYRVGALFVVDENAAVKQRVGSQVKRIIRALYSNPPAPGAFIVAEALKQDDLRQQWYKDLEKMRHRLSSMRASLIQHLEAKKIPVDYLRHHRGMFSLLDLDKGQIAQLIEKFAIYLIDIGRINVAGLTSKNIDYVVNGIASICAKR